MSIMRETRQRKLMTIAELAHAVGLTPATISRYENGQRTPDVETAKSIAEVLGVPWYQLIDNRKAV